MSKPPLGGGSFRQSLWVCGGQGITSGRKAETPANRPTRFARSTSRTHIRRRSTVSRSVLIAIAIRSGAERKICCCGLWKSRAPIDQSLSLAAARRRPRVMRSWSPTRVSPRSTSAKQACATPEIFKQTRHTKFAAPPACDRADRGAWRDVRPDRLHGGASPSQRPRRRS